MLCIPTHVRATRDNPEIVRALCVLVAELRERGLTDGSDVAQPHRDARWQYLCSTPFRGDEGSIAYLHVFRHACHPATGEPLTLGVPAVSSWWPGADCEVLSPPKSGTKARLRLVS